MGRFKCFNWLDRKLIFDGSPDARQRPLYVRAKNAKAHPAIFFEERKDGFFFNRIVVSGFK